MDTKTKPRVMVSAVFLCVFFQVSINFGSDTISVSQSLSGNQTIVSAGKVFELGFFSPGMSLNYYIGIWYEDIPATVVWVANREKPVSDMFSSALRISYGNLVLFNESQIPVWSTYVDSTTSSSVRAVLQDDGNLVFVDGYDSPRILWQSFDSPADTLLPGARFSYSKRTKLTIFFSLHGRILRTLLQVTTLLS